MSFWRCPNCGADLARVENTLRCINGHQFDLAKQGYCNLLLANQKNSRDPGDNVEMIDARRLFLESGHYNFLVEAINTLMIRHIDIANTPNVNIVDVGCGEGYYLNHVIERLSNLPSCSDGLEQGKISVKGYGIDISKVACKRAAAKYKQLEIAVASSVNLPAMNDMVHCAINVFAPYSSSEIARCLADQGVFIRVSPGEKHLKEIKAMLYDEVISHKMPVVDAEFTLLDSVSVVEILQLSLDELSNLVAMTPLVWHGDQARKQQLLAEGLDRVTANFVVQVFGIKKVESSE